MIDKLIEGNKKFCEEIFGPEHLDRLAEGQQPHTCWIGCSDSRVPPAIITGCGDGDLFVHRNVANLVPPHDTETGAVLEYAVKVLKVKQIVLCGHYGCGGIFALLRGVDHRTHIGHWLENAGEALRNLQKRPDFADMPEENALRFLVEENLRVQFRHTMAYPFVREVVKNKQLRVHMVVYDLATGRLNKLNDDGKYSATE